MREQVAKLDETIKSAIESINQGVKGSAYDIAPTIDFELAVVNMDKGEGGVKLYVVGIDGKVSKEELSRIKFSLPRKPEGGFSALAKNVPME